MNIHWKGLEGDCEAQPPPSEFKKKKMGKFMRDHMFLRAQTPGQR